MGRWTSLLASDMDGTVIPLDDGPGWKADVGEFRREAESREGLCLAYVTGRDRDMALAGIEEHRLPHPHFLVCDVGTSVYVPRNGDYVADREYARRMKGALDGATAADVRRALDGTPDLHLQPEPRQTPFKVSYLVPPAAHHRAVLAEVRGRIAAAAAPVEAVFSVRAPDGAGLVDVLPAGVAKDAAVHYLMEASGVDHGGLAYAGDSGNDVAALLAGFQAIVVANADEALKEELRARAGERGILHHLYFAESRYAAGVLEGCRHFGLL